MNNQHSLLLLLPLIALITPFILLPIEYIAPYPFIIEEIAKGIFIFFILSLPNRKTQFLYAVLIGLLFALSENMLYIFNIITVGSLSFLVTRVIFTTTLHVGTMLIILIVSCGNRKLIPLGVIAAGVVHYIYNTWALFL